MSLWVWIFGKLITNCSCNKCWPAEFVPEGTVHKRVRVFQRSCRAGGGHKLLQDCPLRLAGSFVFVIEVLVVSSIDLIR